MEIGIGSIFRLLDTAEEQAYTSRKERMIWGDEGARKLFEFQAPPNPLLEGKPLTLKFPYEGDPEDHGQWWIEFIPAEQKKGP